MSSEIHQTCHSRDQPSLDKNSKSLAGASSAVASKCLIFPCLASPRHILALAQTNSNTTVLGDTPNLHRATLDYQQKDPLFHLSLKVSHLGPPEKIENFSYGIFYCPLLSLHTTSYRSAIFRTTRNLASPDILQSNKQQCEHVVSHSMHQSTTPFFGTYMRS